MIASKNKFTDKDYDYLKNEVFLYLDDLRESGETNMFGAVKYIQNDFELAKPIAQKYLSDWMRNFGKKRNDNDNDWYIRMDTRFLYIQFSVFMF